MYTSAANQRLNSTARVGGSDSEGVVVTLDESVGGVSGAEADQSVQDLIIRNQNMEDMTLG